MLYFVVLLVLVLYRLRVMACKCLLITMVQGVGYLFMLFVGMVILWMGRGF